MYGHTVLVHGHSGPIACDAMLYWFGHHHIETNGASEGHAPTKVARNEKRIQSPSISDLQWSSGIHF